VLRLLALESFELVVADGCVSPFTADDVWFEAFEDSNSPNPMVDRQRTATTNSTLIFNAPDLFI
jgi:hypothetical protein